MSRICSDCKKELDENCFYFNRKRNDYQSKCKECNKKYNRIWKRTDKGRIWRKRYRGQYENKNCWFASLRFGAKKRNLEFTITIDDIVIPEFCPILGIKLQRNKGMPKDNSISVDRIDNSKGYIKGNVYVISYKANRMKGSMTLEILEKLLEYMKSIKSDSP